ncbi:GNAT family N-acetyltransferase [Nocardiopsis ansamitocini]|uniref:N-acetyltransferase domain-containing protein n=1 Tax=Nocardiopsis ansamitocini TaxID=1670832 RepID=A0A9W6P872_9ACTN|nr:GNAT family N-acetyltransferase [Nocardiopsis ansamitocini]GLU48773.1 hypothetical protein Nans01_31240 [Nocardiopsis ansamitocini]
MVLQPPARTDRSVRAATLTDPGAALLVEALLEEYTRRYSAEGAAHELASYPLTDFAPPRGALLLVEEGASVIAGGALRRYDEGTAEVKRVWTHPAHRRRGLARQVMGALETEAVRLGYTRVFLSTGPAQPEAMALYRVLGYRARDGEGFDESGRRRYFAFDKPLSGAP